MTRRALLIINGNSRSGREANAQVIEGLRRLGIDPIQRECSSREQLSPLIVKEGVQADMVLIGGGDGTLNAAAAGLAELKLPLGILPLGTANDLARTLGIPPDLESALDIIGGGRIRSIDVGTVNDVMYFNVASIRPQRRAGGKTDSRDEAPFWQTGLCRYDASRAGRRPAVPR